MAEKKVTLSKKDRMAVFWRSTFLQGPSLVNYCFHMHG